MSDFSRIDKKVAVSVNELVIEEPLFELLGNVNNQRIIDLGCGSGHYAERLTKLGAIVTGVDKNPSAIAVAEARELQGAKFLLGDFTEYAGGDHYDTALAIFSLNELPLEEFKLSLQAVCQCLNADGRLIFAIPHPEHDYLEQTAIIRREGLTGADANGQPYTTHITLNDGQEIEATDYHYSRDFITRCLNDVGFKITTEKEPIAKGSNQYSERPFYLLIEAALRRQE